MTTLQLAQRLTRNLTHTDVRTLPPEEMQRVVDAINTGLAEYVELLPELRRAEPRRATLNAPVAKNAAVTHGSDEVSFVSFPEQADYLGGTVQVSTDSGRYQRLVALNTLLASHNGPTGTAALTLYSDAVQFGPDDDSVSGEVVLVEGNTRHNMVASRPLEWQGYRPRAMGIVGFQPYALELGLPRYWWMEALTGMAGLDAPIYVMRVWPVPATPYDLLFQQRVFPPAVSMTDLLTPRVMPVLATEEAHLVNLCMPGMITSRLWSEAADKQAVRLDYDRARQAMLPKLERSGSTQAAWSGTPFGF